MTEFGVRGIALDVEGNLPVVLLESADGKLLPIWIGGPEAYSIGMALKNYKPPRPMTHDLLISIVHGLGAKFRRVVISGISNGTFYALIHLELKGELVVIDARPSDTIALALRSKVPIFVEDSIPVFSPNDAETMELRRRLREIKPEDMGF